MSRFLTRALAAVRAEVVAIAPPAPAPKHPEPGFGGFGGFGEREEMVLPPTSPPARFDWPEGSDYWLTHDAVKLAGILNTGGSYKWCPSGGLDMWRESGLYVGFGALRIAALRAAGLLPEDLR